MKEQKYKLGKKRIDKLCKQFGLNIIFQHNLVISYTAGYCLKWQDIFIDLQFSRRNVLCWTSTGTIETIFS